MPCALTTQPTTPQVLELVLDLGRIPLARFPDGCVYLSLVSGTPARSVASRLAATFTLTRPDYLPTREVALSDTPLTREQLDAAIATCGEFGADNRAGINRTLHRISCIRNRAGGIVGLTCRMGRAVGGSAELVRDIVTSGASVLLLGRPGVGKTTAIREISRMLSDEVRAGGARFSTSRRQRTRSLSCCPQPCTPSSRLVSYSLPAVLWLECLAAPTRSASGAW